MNTKTRLELIRALIEAIEYARLDFIDHNMKNKTERWTVGDYKIMLNLTTTAPYRKYSLAFCDCSKALINIHEMWFLDFSDDRFLVTQCSDYARYIDPTNATAAAITDTLKRIVASL